MSRVHPTPIWRLNFHYFRFRTTLKLTTHNLVEPVHLASSRVDAWILFLLHNLTYFYHFTSFAIRIRRSTRRMVSCICWREIDESKKCHNGCRKLPKGKFIIVHETSNKTDFDIAILPLPSQIRPDTDGRGARLRPGPRMVRLKRQRPRPAVPRGEHGHPGIRILKFWSFIWVYILWGGGRLFCN